MIGEKGSEVFLKSPCTLSQSKPPTFTGVRLEFKRRVENFFLRAFPNPCPNFIPAGSKMPLLSSVPPGGLLVQIPTGLFVGGRLYRHLDSRRNHRPMV
jgi:hypothetical protein